MKKTLLSAILLSFGFAHAQTFVSMTPENRKVIIEEFTGVNCVFCPQGHTIANQIVQANPNNAFVINIHQGSFAQPSAGQPDFRTTFGNAIAGQTGLSGYPAATVNRDVFPGIAPQGNPGTTALNRNNWTAAANQVLQQSSYVNVAVQGNINVQNNVITVIAEVYYTASSPQATNKLNIALLQNNTLGPQTGGNMGNNYNHQHRLIHMLTGQWGVDITSTATGSFSSQTITYTIPANLNGVPIEIGELELVAFVTETQQKVVSGNGAKPTFTGLASNDAKLKSVEPISPECLTTVAPKVTIQNLSQNPMTSLPIQYSINNGAVATFNWTGNLNSMQNAVVTLPSYNFVLQNSNTLNVSIPSDENNQNNTGSATFSKAGSTITNNLTIKITTDRYGEETTWTLKNSSGVTVASGGPYSQMAANGAYPQPDVNISVPVDCYTFQINDSYGDGMSSGYGVGSYQVLSDGVLISGVSGGTFGSSDTKKFGVEGVTSADEFNIDSIKFYPNPTQGIVNISLPESALVTVTDLSGKVIINKEFSAGESSFDLGNLSKGLYIINFKGDQFRKTDKIILK